MILSDVVCGVDDRERTIGMAPAGLFSGMGKLGVWGRKSPRGGLEAKRPGADDML